MSDQEGTCGSCRHFSVEPGALERAFPGLKSLSSAYAAVRAGDGLCRLNDRYVGGRSRCVGYTRGAAGSPC